MRVAIIGTGISGLCAAHRLAGHCELALYEAGEHPGGHSNTVEVAMDGQRLAIDTGFIVYNERTYPGFTALLAGLGVATQASDMSFSFRCADTGLEYRGDNTFDAMFAQRRNLFRPAFHRMIREILRFNGLAGELVAAEPAVTLGEFLDRHGFTGTMVDDYLLPMAGAIWSAEPARILAFPAAHFGRFFRNHGLLQVDGRPEWRTVTGGSREYVRTLLRPLRDRLHLATPVEGLERHADRVTLKARGRPPADYDHVILACHSDQALGLLGDPSDAEREVLGAIGWQDNDAVLHTDTRLLPRRSRAWAAWNYHRDGSTGTGRVSVTYNLTRLQSLPTRRQFLVTLNGEAAVDPAAVVHRQTYSHPVFDAAAIRAQGRRDEINGVRRTWYCGAWWGYGFHEDGVQSAVAVCNALLPALAGARGGRALPADGDHPAADAQRYLSGTR